MNKAVDRLVSPHNGSGDNEQVRDSNHDGLCDCLDGAGGIGVSRVHTHGMCQLPYTARSAPKMRQATRACGPRSEVVPRAL